MMCEVLDLPRSTYYQTLAKTVSNRDQENQLLTKKICDIYTDSKARYGAPKIHQSLLKTGLYVSLKRVQRLMKKADIRSITVKKIRPQVNHTEVVARENHLDQDFSTTMLNEKWVAGVTWHLF
jgi:putative transposase